MYTFWLLFAQYNVTSDDNVWHLLTTFLGVWRNTRFKVHRQSKGILLELNHLSKVHRKASFSHSVTYPE